MEVQSPVLGETFDYWAYFDDPEARRRCLAQVVRQGWARLADAPHAAGEVERFIASFGYVRETNYKLRLRCSGQAGR